MKLKNRIGSACSAVLLLTSVGQPASAAAGEIFNSSPGKKAVYVTVEDYPVQSVLVSSEPISLSLKKAKSKSVVEVSVVLSGVLPAGTNPYTTIIGVSPVAYAPFPGWGKTCSLSNAELCSLRAIYYIDVDAAELADPGTVRNQPLNLDLYVTRSDAGVVDPTVDVAVSARLQRK